LEKRKEARRRNLSFHLPVIVPLAPNVRIVEDEASYVSLQDVYDDHCHRTTTHKDEPVFRLFSEMKEVMQKRSLKDFQNAVSINEIT
jgi:transformation/transcription domain-associated protein